MPFGGYDDFDDCVRKNRQKKDPKAYCAAIQNAVEGPPARRRVRESIEAKVGTDPMRPHETS